MSLFYRVYALYIHFFFFKQKTAYEMRISDWSSDVCSSDLGLYAPELVAADRALHIEPPRPMGLRGRGGEHDCCERQQTRGPSQIGRASCRERVCQYV